MVEAMSQVCLGIMGLDRLDQFSLVELGVALDPFSFEPGLKLGAGDQVQGLSGRLNTDIARLDQLVNVLTIDAIIVFEILRDPGV